MLDKKTRIMLNRQKTRILIAEDHPIYREGLRLSLTLSKLNCEVVAEARNVCEAVEYIERHPNGIDLAMLDFFLPDGNGHDIIKVLKALCPQAKIMLITGEVDNPEVKKVTEENIDGIISKDVQSTELTAIVSDIINVGHQDHCDSDPDTDFESTDFTKRELEIIQLCVKGLNAKEMAETLCISPRTVEHHKEKIFRKSGCNSALELMKYAMQHGLV